MSQRIQRVNKLIKEELGKILLQESEFPKDILTTLTRVESSANLRESRVYVSVIPEEKMEQVLESLNKNIYDFQQTLNKRLHMRPVPKIIFIEEKQTQEAGRIDEILSKIKTIEERSR